MKTWYRREGYVQFLLGNMWNDYDSRATSGRETLVVCWVLLLAGVAGAVVSFIALGGTK